MSEQPKHVLELTDEEFDRLEAKRRAVNISPAPELSAEELATVERFEVAPAAEESLRERVARAICDADGDGVGWEDRAYADAAIAVLRGPSSDAERAVERVLALADFHAECCEYVKVRDLRAAVEGPSC